MRLLPGVAVVTLLTAATPEGPPDPAPARAATTHTVEIRNFAFSPARLEVAPGDTIVWINRDAAPHTVTDSLGSWDSAELGAGDRWTWIANEVGRVSYLCAYHPSMRGTLTVQTKAEAQRRNERI